MKHFALALCGLTLLTVSSASAQDIKLSFGGQERFRYEYLAEDRSQLLIRKLVHADLQLAKPLRIFAQLGSFLALDATRVPAEPPAANALALTQVFVETAVRLRDVQLTVRVGRQELALGSTRWVSTRDGTNVRQTFELIRVTTKQAGAWNIETFAGTATDAQRGVFDDAPAWRDGFWGVYGTFGLIPERRLACDVFYLGRSRHDATYAGITGRDTRHTLGLRLFGETAFGMEYIQHALLQLGSFGDAPIQAWALSSALWQHLPGALSALRVGLRADALSGDRKPGRGALRTFHPLFPNQTFFSALPAIYPSNLYALHPLLRFHSRQLDLEAGCTFFWRQAVSDAVYQPPGIQLSNGLARSRYIGAQLSVGFIYRANSFLSLNAEYSHLFAGPAITGDLDFIGAWATCTY